MVESWGVIWSFNVQGKGLPAKYTRRKHNDRTCLKVQQVLKCIKMKGRVFDSADCLHSFVTR